MLIRGARLVTMAAGARDQVSDVLIERGRIAAIGPSIEAPGAELIDAHGMLAAPGFVDTHRHVWQTQLRTIATDWSLHDYVVYIRAIASTFYTAADVYLGNHVGALEALDAGVTTLVDHCHIVNSPDHAEEAVRGLQDAGIRAIYCYGTFVNTPRVPMDVPADPNWRVDTAKHLRKGRLSSDGGLVRFGFAPYEAGVMSLATLADELSLARSLGAAAISCHGGVGAYDRGDHVVEKMHEAGLLGPDILFVHGSAFTDRELGLLRDAGCAISATPETELQMGMGFPVAHRAREQGVKVGLGVDIVSNYSGDMFMPMRLGLQATRGLRNLENYERKGKAPKRISPGAADVLRMATLGGAEAIRMDGQIGSIEIGKRADIILVRTDALHMTPVHDAIGALVLNARPSDIDTVLVDGRAVKRHGKLLTGDWQGIRPRFTESCARIMEGVRSVDPAPIDASWSARWGSRLV